MHPQDPLAGVLCSCHIPFPSGCGNPLERQLLTVRLTGAEAALCPPSCTGGPLLPPLTPRAKSAMLPGKLSDINDNKTVAVSAMWTCKYHTKH